MTKGNYKNATVFVIWSYYYYGEVSCTYLYVGPYSDEFLYSPINWPCVYVSLLVSQTLPMDICDI